jgi:NADH:ubiquinone oxidoreductase subunit 5 (subunit L)/multisubunit Na+/H+ antiporter MnhA subunit
LVGLAAVGFFGALFHTVNHGIFKSLLFLNSGSMLWATGTDNLNRLGGLMRHMPITGITVLVASFSIAGVPLFNGFASKWSIYVASIQGGAAARFLPVCALLAILTSALTLASFVKFFGASFLSRSSALVKEKAGPSGWLEVGWSMRLPQVMLALLCVLLGLFPAAAFGLMQLAVESSRQGYGIALASAAPMGASGWAGIAAFDSRAVLAPILILAVLGLGLGAAGYLTRLGGARRRADAPWLCGYAREAEQHRYSAHGFYAEIKRYFRWIGGTPPPAGKAPLPRRATTLKKL